VLQGIILSDIERVAYPHRLCEHGSCEATIDQRRRNGIQFKTILNRVQKFKSFVYGAVRWVEGAAAPTIEVEVRSGSNNRPVCSGRGRGGPGYDRLPVRRIEFVPMGKLVTK